MNRAPAVQGRTIRIVPDVFVPGRSGLWGCLILALVVLCLLPITAAADPSGNGNDRIEQLETDLAMIREEIAVKEKALRQWQKTMWTSGTNRVGGIKKDAEDAHHIPDRNARNPAGSHATNASPGRAFKAVSKESPQNIERSLRSLREIEAAIQNELAMLKSRRNGQKAD